MAGRQLVRQVGIGPAPRVRRALRGLRAAAALLLALAPGAALASQPPRVYHSDLPGGSNPGGSHEVTAAPEVLKLQLAIGSVDSDVSEEICVDGTGDEICGFTIVLHASGGLGLVDYQYSCDGQTGACGPEPVHVLDVGAGELRLNRLGPAIDSATSPLYLGDLTVMPGVDPGEIRVVSGSEAVTADLGLVGVTDADPLAHSVPEPGLLVSLFAGALLLVALSRRRTRRAAVAPAIVFLLAAQATLAPESHAQQYIDEATFLAATGASSRVGFETVPIAGSGFAGLGNDTRIGQVTLSSLSVATDIDLAWTSGAPLGVFGTLLVADPTFSGDPFLWPGGTGSGTGSRRNDDVRIVFDAPVQAAGLTILENIAQAGETVTFLDSGGAPIATFAMPGNGTPPGGDGFIGYAIQAGDPPIAAIELDESAIGADDIGLDEILYDGAADPWADLWDGYTPTLSGGEPTLPNRDPAQSLEAPDATTVSLGVGGKLIVRFVDNALTGSGDGAADLRIYEGGSVQEAMFVSVSANGSAWIDLGSVAGGTTDVDLDPFGIDENDEMYFVRILDDPNDGPTSGPTVGADIDAVEALSGALDPPDADSDGVADLYDDCVDVYDESQLDDDADGVGNACDNCRYVPNPNQDDTDKDGEGDACEPARIRLVRIFSPTYSEGGYDLANLFIDCGGFDVRAVTLGLWIPPHASNLDFGKGCVAPPPGWEPPGAPTGAGCGGATGIGPNVAPLRSGAFGVPMGIAPPAGFRSDVVYVVLRGLPANGGRLCSAFETNVPLGVLRAGVLGGSYQGVASISLEDPIASAWCLTEDGSGSCAPAEGTIYMLASPLPNLADIRIQPAGGQPAGGNDEWDICLTSATTDFMHRVTMGLLGPGGAAYGSLLMEGCTSTPNGSGERTCPGEVGADPTWVDETVTFTQGPLPAASGAILAETLYTPMDGGAPTIGAGLALNPFLGLDHCVGVVRNTAPATPGAPPIPVRDGFYDLSYHDVAEPYQTVDGELDSRNVYETLVFNAGDDIDLDGHVDVVDNCPFAFNEAQDDEGGFQSLVENGVGNACECGDANASGAVLGDESPLEPDLQLIREYLLGMHSSDPHIPVICSVHGDTGCDTADAVVLERALAGLGPGVLQRCDAAVD